MTTYIRLNSEGDPPSTTVIATNKHGNLIHCGNLLCLVCDDETGQMQAYVCGGYNKEIGLNSNEERCLE